MFKKFFNTLKQKLFKGHDSKTGTAGPTAHQAKDAIPKTTSADNVKVNLKVARKDRRRQGDRNSSWLQRVPYIEGFFKSKTGVKQQFKMRRRTGVHAHNPPGTKRIPPTLMMPFDGRFLADPGAWVKGRKQRGGYGRAA